MDRPTISIAMCTYNGERYLEEQLNSLLAQSLLPTEVIICDDGSSDGTVALLENFQDNGLFKVKLFKNGVSLGVTKNFEKAIANCDGDFIFPCDQDDSWLPEKIEVLTAFLKNNPDVEMVFSNAELVDDSLKKLNRTQWEVVRFDKTLQKRWKAGKAADIMLGGNRVTGCTTAFRSELAAAAMPFPTDIPDTIHDTWLAWVGVVRQSILPLNVASVHYRQHEAQQVGSRPRIMPAKIGFKERFSRPRSQKLTPLIEERETLQKLYVRLSGIEKSEGLKTVRNKLDFLTMRSQLPNNRLLRVMPVAWNLLNGNYHKYQDQEANWKAPWMASAGDILE